MRQWIEKLSKISKERGIFCSGQVHFGTYKWHTYGCDNINDGVQTASIKIYQDELDLLSETETLVANNTRDNIIKELENL